MNKREFFLIALLAFIFVPVVVGAQQSIAGILDLIKGWLTTLIPIVTALGLIYFLWGLADFIRTGSAEAKEEGRNRMIWGIITLFVMVSVWGLVRFVGRSLGIENDPNNTTIDTPQFPKP